MTGVWWRKRGQDHLARECALQRHLRFAAIWRRSPLYDPTWSSARWERTRSESVAARWRLSRAGTNAPLGRVYGGFGGNGP